MTWQTQRAVRAALHSVPRSGPIKAVWWRRALTEVRWQWRRLFA